MSCYCAPLSPLPRHLGLYSWENPAVDLGKKFIRRRQKTFLCRSCPPPPASAHQSELGGSPGGGAAGLQASAPAGAARGLGGKGEAQASPQPLSLTFPPPLPHRWLISCNWQAHCSLGLPGEMGVCVGVVLIYACHQGHLSLILAPGLT